MVVENTVIVIHGRNVMNKLRFTSLIIAVLMILAALCACGEQTGTDADTSTEAQPAVTTAPAETAEPEITVAVENLSEGGSPLPFNMLVRQSRYAYLFADTVNGEMLNDAVHKRNLSLEDDYGIKLSITECASEAAAFTSYLTGSSDFDLVCFDYWWNLDLKGLLLNIKDMPEINTEDPWWYQGWNNNVTINGRMYSIAGDASLEMLENLEVMFFNKQMAGDRSLDLYADVSSGKWTVDRLIETVNAVSAGFDDSDTTNDLYGVMYDVHSIDAQMYSCGLKIAELTPESVTIDNASGTMNMDIADKLVTLMKNVGVNYSSATARARDWTTFRDSKSLIYATALYLGKSLKSAGLGFDYGIIPLPKFSEDSEYISTSYGVSVFGIPAGVNNAHNSALVLNAMNFRSGRTDDSVVTTFYEVVLKYQVANSTDDVKNLDIVKNNVYIDFAFIYNVGVDSAYKNAIIGKSVTAAGIKAAVKSGKNTLERNILKFYTE